MVCTADGRFGMYAKGNRMSERELMKIDEMGNIFAVYPGLDPSLPPIGMGSHLDTQPAGSNPHNFQS